VGQTERPKREQEEKGRGATRQKKRSEPSTAAVEPDQPVEPSSETEQGKGEHLNIKV
jgi:hypothetical protein